MATVVEKRSIIQADPEAVWQRALTPEGINHELMPIMRMTVPRAARGRTLEDVAPGERLGRAWLLLLGFLPFDYDDITVAEIGPGMRFLERSKMLSIRRWQHERIVEPTETGATCLVDRIAFELRRPAAWVPFLPRLLGAALGAVFAHRHERVARYHADQDRVAP